MLGDGAIEKYGRADLYEVFLATRPVTLVKACKCPKTLFNGVSVHVWHRPPSTPPR